MNLTRRFSPTWNLQGAPSLLTIAWIPTRRSGLSSLAFVEPEQDGARQNEIGFRRCAWCNAAADFG